MMKFGLKERVNLMMMNEVGTLTRSSEELPFLGWYHLSISLCCFLLPETKSLKHWDSKLLTTTVGDAIFCSHR